MFGRLYSPNLWRPFGRLRGHSVAARPNRFAVRNTQVSLPNGRLRCTLASRKKLPTPFFFLTPFRYIRPDSFWRHSADCFNDEAIVLRAAVGGEIKCGLSEVPAGFQIAFRHD